MAFIDRGRPVYSNLDTLKQSWLLGDRASDEEMSVLLSGVSQWIDGYCGRRFGPIVIQNEIRVDAAGVTILEIPALHTFSGVFKRVRFADPALMVELETTEYDVIRQRHAGFALDDLGFDAIELKEAPSVGDIIVVDGLYFYGGVERRPAKVGFNFQTDDPPASELLGGKVYEGVAAESGVAFTGADIPFGPGDTIFFARSLSDMASRFYGFPQFEGFPTIARVLDVDRTATPPTVTLLLNVDGSIWTPTTSSAGADTFPPYVYHPPRAIGLACAIMCSRLFTRGPTFEPFYVDADVDTDVYLLLEPWRSRGMIL